MVTTGQREAAQSLAGQLSGLLVQAVDVVRGLAELRVDPTALGAVGHAVLAEDADRHEQQVAALHGMLNLLWDATDLPSAAVTSVDSRPANGLWSAPIGVRLAALAAGDGTGVGRPHSVHAVLGCLVGVGLARADGLAGVPSDSVAEFTAWLDAAPDNQMAMGVVGVYTGPARGFHDVPSGVYGGDVVAIEPATGDPVLGVVGNAGHLHNDGPVSADFGAVATIRVYRPMVPSGR
jgi:hypothetical protein